MVFNVLEMRSRHQFHELFCTKYLYTGARGQALNDTPWNATILNDIVQTLYPGNVLTPNDIEAILNVGGFYDNTAELYFHYHDNTPLTRDILSAISPYITQEAYVLSMQKLLGNVDNSGEIFIKLCCMRLNKKPIRVPAKELYTLYQEWCTINGLFVLSKRAFNSTLINMGIKRGKGYVDGSSGIDFFMVRLSMEEEDWHVESPPKKASEQKGEDGEKSLRDVARRREKICGPVIQYEESSVPSAEGGKNTSTGSTGVDVVDGTTGRTASADDTASPSNPDNEDDFDWGAEDGNGEDTTTFINGTATDADPARLSTPGEKVEIPEQLSQFNKLPLDVRQFCKMMKITYKVAPEHFTQQDFTQAYKLSGLATLQEKQLNKLYILFLEYVEKK